jgi:outer membrane protein W
MFRHTVRSLYAFAIASLAFVASASASDQRFELGGSAGWTFSDGVTFTGVLAGDGNVYNGIEPKDAFSYSLSLGYHATDNVEVGFLFGQQKSTLQLSGTAVRNIGDMSVDNYHGYVAYNFGDSDANVRPYVMGGAGFTHYGGVPYTVGSVSGTTGGESQFSTIWGLGVKLYPSHSVGLNLGARWVPTYIKSDSAGWWCDPYWGCYVAQNAQYSNQFEFAGGLSFRF